MKEIINLNTITSDIWEEFSGYLKKVIKKRVQDEFAVEDILQDVFYNIHKNIDKLEEKSKMKAWLYQITRNKIIDYYRSRKMTVNLFEGAEEEIEQNITDSNMNFEIALCLKPMINNLPEKYREVLILYEYENLTQKEIAEKLNLSVSGVKSRIQRAREKLKQMLLSCCQFEFDQFGNVIEYQNKNNCYCNFNKK